MKEEKQYLYQLKMIPFNLLSIVFFIFLFVITILVKSFDFISSTSDYELTLMFLLYIPYIFLHEILHCIGYMICGVKYRYITFGIHIEKSILCCSCKKNIDKRTILCSLIFPFVFIGLITYIIGIIFNFKILILLSILNMTGCSGDLVMFYIFLKIKDFKYFEYDNPIAFGIITKQDFSNKKLPFFKQIKEEVVQTTNKKIDVSKISIILLLIYVLVLLTDLLS